MSDRRSRDYSPRSKDHGRRYDSDEDKERDSVRSSRSSSSFREKDRDRDYYDRERSSSSSKRGSDRERDSLGKSRRQDLDRPDRDRERDSFGKRREYRDLDRADSERESLGKRREKERDRERDSTGKRRRSPSDEEADQSRRKERKSETKEPEIKIDENDPELLAKMEALESGETEEEREQRLIEERRRKRQELLASLKANVPSEQTPAVSEIQNSQISPIATSTTQPSGTSPISSPPPSTTTLSSSQISPPLDSTDLFEVTPAPNEMFALEKEVSATDSAEALVTGGSGGVGGGAVYASGVSPPPTGAEPATEEVRKREKGKKQDKSSSKFDDGFDMFADSPTNSHGTGVPLGPFGGPRAATAQGPINLSLSENWDDQEGYYMFRTGDKIADRYHVFASFGKGVFSTVLRALDTSQPSTTDSQPNYLELNLPNEVAIKVIRNNESMHKAGMKEIQILELLGTKDPEYKKHCIRLIEYFEYKNHLCMVFEPLLMNLREVLKRFGGKSQGISIHAVQVFTRQLVIALKHLRSCSIIHSDIKPDNILMSDKKNMVKICDLGSAFRIDEVAVTPYLGSRFYRAPEVILGLTYDYAVDMWAIGCSLYELFTGKILFHGDNNNEMLHLFQEWRGPFKREMIRKAQFKEEHFDEEFNFMRAEYDKILCKETVRRVKITKPTRDLSASLFSSMSNPKDESERQKVVAFKDLLEKMLALDPSQRITPTEALRHPFVAPQATATK